MLEAYPDDVKPLLYHLAHPHSPVALVRTREIASAPVSPSPGTWLALLKFLRLAG